MRLTAVLFSRPAGMVQATKVITPMIKELDLPIDGVFLLKSFNHYAMEQERVVVVTQKAM